jgi:putative membrane protein
MCLVDEPKSVAIRWNYFLPAPLVSSLLGSRDGGNKANTAQEPLQILKRRYARGEIDRLEFEAKRQDLLNSYHEGGNHGFWNQL